MLLICKEYNGNIESIKDIKPFKTYKEILIHFSTVQIMV